MFNRSHYYNARPDGFGVMEVVPGPEETGAPPLFVPLKRTELNGEVAGPLASLRLRQTYGYRRAECDKTLEAVYRFPLPGDAAVTGVTVRFGDVEIQAELKERVEAEADYEAAKQAGRQAALATRESPDVFTLSVAGLQPDQEILVETAYVQLARPAGAGWSLRIPLTTSPRYVRSDESGSRHAQGQPLALLRDPGHRFALNLTVREAEGIESATHKLEVTSEGGALFVRLKDGEVTPDRDCVLSWSPIRESRQPALSVLTHYDSAGFAYFAALLAPPAVPAPEKGAPREIVLLVDHSGSMEGAKWQAADWAVKQFLAQLTDQDSFALGLFHNNTRWFQKAPVRAEASVVADAVRFLLDNTDSGGTELGVALEQALHLKRSGREPVRHVSILTDAEVSDAGRILGLADAERTREDRRRVSVLCIDASPNALLATELAERGGGVAYFLTSAPEEEDISTALDEILANWAAPILPELRLEVAAPAVESPGREIKPGKEAGWTAIDLGDLIVGRPLWVSGRVKAEAGETLRFRAVNREGREAAGRSISLAESPPMSGLKPLFGARRVLGLEYLMSAGAEEAETAAGLRRLGYDPRRELSPEEKDGRKTVYAENRQANTTRTLRDLLVREALDYGLASSETAFVAVRTEAGKKVEGTVTVANALPAGWSGDFLAGAAPPPAMTMAAYMAAPAQPSPLSGGAPPPPFAAGRAPTAPMPPGQMPPQTRGGHSQSGMGIGGKIRRLFSGGGSGAGAQSPPDFEEALPQAEALQDFAAPMPEAEALQDFAGPTPQAAPLFSGIANIVNGEAVLFDSDQGANAGRLPETALFTGLQVKILNGAVVDPSLFLLLYIDDMAAPRARVRLADLLQQGGSRPLNLRRAAGQRVRLVLTGSADGGITAPSLEVRLAW